MHSHGFPAHSRLLSHLTDLIRRHGRWRGLRATFMAGRAHCARPDEISDHVRRDIGLLPEPPKRDPMI